MRTSKKKNKQKKKHKTTTKQYFVYIDCIQGTCSFLKISYGTQIGH